METVFGQELIQTVRDIAAEDPNFIYLKPSGAPRCAYVDTIKGERKPGCLIGQALLRTGAITLDFADENRNTDGVGDLFDSGVLPTVTDDEKRWLDCVQSYQDVQQTWGTAVANADQDYD